MNQIEKEVCAEIGNFFLVKNGGDYEKTRVEMEALRVTGVSVANFILPSGKTSSPVTITLERPGLLIGYRGKTIKSLEQSLKRPVLVKEDLTNLSYYLIPTNYDPCDFE